MKTFRYLTALGLSLGLFSTPAAEAVLISVKSLGMAGVGIGYAQDAMAAAHNPGSAAAIDNRMDFGLTYSHLKGDVRLSGNQAPVPDVNGKFNAYDRMSNFFSPNFGLNYNVDCNWTVGLVTYNRDAAKTTFKHPFPLLGTTKPGLEYMHQTIAPYIAYRWGCHNFGVSFNWDIQRAKVNGFQNFQAASVSPTNVTNKGYNWSNGLGYTFGYYGQLTDTFSIGATYQPETQMSRLKKYKGFLAHGGKFNIPEKIGAGFSWRFMECATFAFDYEFVHWRQVKAVKNPLLNEVGGLNPLGSNDGPGFGWKDKNYYRMGVDYAWSEDLILRAGYRYAKTQVRKSQTVLNGFTLEPIIESLVTVGATYVLSCQSEIDFFAGYGFPKKLKGTENSIPVQFGGGRADLKQDLWACGLSWGYKY